MFSECNITTVQLIFFNICRRLISFLVNLKLLNFRSKSMKWYPSKIFFIKNLQLFSYKAVSYNQSLFRMNKNIEYLVWIRPLQFFLLIYRTKIFTFRISNTFCNPIYLNINEIKLIYFPEIWVFFSICMNIFIVLIINIALFSNLTKDIKYNGVKFKFS